MLTRLYFQRTGTVQVALLIGTLLLLSGCRSDEYAPVRGKVMYRGTPLTFGSVMFQPEAGQPAYGYIQKDGSFYLSTNGDGDGARIGPNKVRVACFETQQPQPDGTIKDEPGLGPTLIPTKYNSFEHSGLVVEVPPEGTSELVLELVD